MMFPMHAAHGRSLVDTLMHSIVWSVGRRFVNHLPLPLVIGVAIIGVVIYALRRLGGGRKSARTQTATTTHTVTSKHEDANGNIVTDRTVYRD